MASDITTIQDTINYAIQNKLSIIPIKYKEKIPEIKWKEYQQRRASDQEITDWFSEGNLRNIGFICGDISGGNGKALNVLDFDDRELYNAFFPRGHETKISETFKGYHAFFFLSEPMKKSRIEIDKNGIIVGIDIQGKGGYVVVPPSVHPSGIIYKWVNDRPITFVHGTAEHFREVIDRRLEIICEKHNWVLKTEISHKPEIKNTEGYWQNGRPLPDVIATELMKEFIFKTIIDTEEILYYDPSDGLYHYGGEQLIKRETQSGKYGMGKTKTTISVHWQNEVINIVQARTYIERKSINANSNMIHLKDGIYNLNTGELIDFTPNIISMVNIPVIYNPNADCPQIKKFLSEILDGGDIPIIEEMTGYCLYRDMPIHKAVMLLGEGANGKSTLLRLIKAFLGNGNVSTISLQNLDNNRFATSGLCGKLANIVPDIPSKALVQTSMFKALTGGDSIPAEKKFREQFSFDNYAKLIYSCNELPETHDDTYAFYRRWVLINFPNIFEGKNDDKSLIKKLTTPTELSGLFNLAIKGLIRLLENGEFTNSKSTEETRRQYIWSSDSLWAYIEECIDTNPDGWIPTEEFYNDYCEFCRGYNLPIKAKNIVGRDIQQHVKVERIRRGFPRQVHGYLGISKKSEKEEDTLQNESEAHSIENFGSDNNEKEEIKE